MNQPKSTQNIKREMENTDGNIIIMSVTECDRDTVSKIYETEGHFKHRLKGFQKVCFIINEARTALS